MERATVEIRYAPAYLLWDRAGQLWTTCLEKWPNLKNVEAIPARTVFHLEREGITNYEFVAELQNARIIAHRPKSNLKEFSEMVSEFFGFIIKILELNSFERIGFRLMSVKQMKILEEALKITCGLALLNIPEEKAFGFDRKDVSPEIILLLEGEECGARVRIVGQQTSLQLTAPPGVFEEPIKKTNFRVMYDIDYFTKKQVEVPQINFSEWIQNAYRVIKRDSDYFLRERSR